MIKLFQSLVHFIYTACFLLSGHRSLDLAGLQTCFARALCAIEIQNETSVLFLGRMSALRTLTLKNCFDNASIDLLHRL